MGRKWAAGYTVTLDEYGKDISEAVRAGQYPLAVGHTREKQAMERTLSRKGNANALLVGEAGSGRTRLVKDFASRSMLGEYHEEKAGNYYWSFGIVDSELACLGWQLKR